MDEWEVTWPTLATPEETRAENEARDLRAATRRAEMDANRAAVQNRRIAAGASFAPNVRPPTSGPPTGMEDGRAPVVAEAERIERSVGSGSEARAPEQVARGQYDSENPGEVVSLLREVLRRTGDLENRLELSERTPASVEATMAADYQIRPEGSRFLNQRSRQQGASAIIETLGNQARNPVHVETRPVRFEDGHSGLPDTQDRGQLRTHPITQAQGRTPSSSITLDRRAEPENSMPGLEPLSTMVTPFARVVDYRTYRLKNKTSTLSAEEAVNVYDCKRRIDGLHPTLGTFSGSPPIKLLSFLATIRDALDTTGASEAIGMRAIAYFLEGEALDVHEEQLSSATDDYEEELFGESRSCAWPHIIDALLKRFLTDDVLQEAYNSVTRAGQREGEDEAKFAVRLSSSSRLCRHVFRKADVVNYYLCGLKPSVRELVAQHVRMMSPADRVNLAAVKQAAVAIGKSQRALREEVKPIGATKAEAGPKSARLPGGGGKLMMLPWQEDDEEEDRQEERRLAEVAADLGAILYASTPVQEEGSEKRTQDPTGGIQSKVFRDLIAGDEERQMTRSYEGIPELTDAQIRQAVTVVPGDYWQLSCWTCRDGGHSTFTCPFLQPTQRLYFAYRYYLHQIEANPDMAKFLEERLAWRLDPKNARPRPTHERSEFDRGDGYQKRGSRGRGGLGGRGGGTWRPSGRRGVFLVNGQDEEAAEARDTGTTEPKEVSPTQEKV